MDRELTLPEVEPMSITEIGREIDRRIWRLVCVVAVLLAIGAVMAYAGKKLLPYAAEIRPQIAQD